MGKEMNKKCRQKFIIIEILHQKEKRKSFILFPSHDGRAEKEPGLIIWS